MTFKKFLWLQHIYVNDSYSHHLWVKILGIDYVVELRMQALLESPYNIVLKGAFLT